MFLQWDRHPAGDTENFQDLPHHYFPPAIGADKWGAIDWHAQLMLAILLQGLAEARLRPEERSNYAWCISECTPDSGGRLPEPGLSKSAALPAHTFMQLEMSTRSLEGMTEPLFEIIAWLFQLSLDACAFLGSPSGADSLIDNSNPLQRGLTWSPFSQIGMCEC